MKHANLRVWSVWRVWRQDEACQFKGLERLEGLKAGKRQAWIGEGLPSQQRFKGFKLFRGLGFGGFGGFGAFGGFKGWQTAGLDAHKKPWMCGLGVPVGCRMKHAKGWFKRPRRSH